ncbi:MAG: type II toxin-antitoxin system HicB family antitoxin [Candidatus Thorarchaeota archaeon]
MKYTKLVAQNGNWSQWSKLSQIHSIACCDCGLVHDFEFRIQGDQVQFRAKRLERSTGQIRRHMKRLVWLIPEKEGGFSAIMPNLPGCCSQGETEEEALKNIREAFSGITESYFKKLPYRINIEPIPKNAIERYI